MQKAESMWLFTNRNCLVFDKDGNQIPEYQCAITCYSIDKALALQACNEASEFHVGSFHEWEHPIDRKHMIYLLGIATREE